MPKPGKQIPMIAKNPLSSSDTTGHNDSDSELVQELEAKRQSIDEEILRFRSDKEKEFREFEQALRTNRKRKHIHGTLRQSGKEPSYTSPDRQTRTSSSSALDLLAGHGASQRLTKTGSSSRVGQTSRHTKRTSTSPKAGSAASQPTLSLDPLTIKGETLSQSESHLQATPALLTRTLSQTSLSSPKQLGSSSTAAAKNEKSRQSPITTPSKERTETFLGILTPTYLPLLVPESSLHPTSVSIINSSPGNDTAIASSDASSSVPNNVLPLQSSSFPPRVVTLMPASPTTKRAYTAPAATRMPSALRSASVGNLGRKRKHVTFRLADSAIVEPSSSYEEGPSPDQKPSRSKSTSAVSHSSRKPNSLRFSNVSPRNGLIGDHRRSDEEDEAAGVKPGMSMDEVMQKLNAHLDLEDHEDVGWTETNYHEDVSDDDYSMDNQPLNSNGVDEDEEEEGSNHNDDHDNESDNEPQEDGSSSNAEDSDSYFSPKQHEMPPHPFSHSEPKKPDVSCFRDRSGSSPLTPLRDQNWDALSSSDKDRLLFAGRTSDSDSDHLQRSPHGPRSRRNISPEPGLLKEGFSGLKKTSSSTGLASLTSLSQLGSTSLKQGKQGNHGSNHTQLPHFDDDLGPYIDGGSSIGFFELDEELSSPRAREARMSLADLHTETELETDRERLETDGPSDSSRHLNRAEAAKAEILGTGMASVPINIIRPSVSVSSSWVGTFGH